MRVIISCNSSFIGRVLLASILHPTPIGFSGVVKLVDFDFMTSGFVVLVTFAAYVTRLCESHQQQVLHHDTHLQPQQVQNRPKSTSLSSPIPLASFALSCDNSPDQELSDPVMYSDSLLEIRPPAQTIMFAPPPPPTFTIQQLVAYLVQPPCPPSGASVKAFAEKMKRPTHNSSAASQKYNVIRSVTLRKIPALVVDNFPAQVATLDSIKFDHPICLPRDASPMLS